MDNNRQSTRNFLNIAVCIGNLNAFSAGILVGWSSPVNAKLIDESRLNENPLGEVITSGQESWISSIFGLGAILGPILAGYLTNKLGRKKTLLLSSGVPFLASYLMFAFGKTIILYYTARFIGGFAFGTMLSVLPHFLSEISEDQIRGTVSSSMNVFLMFGTLYAYVLGPYLSIMWFNLSCAVWPAMFLVLFTVFVPESPYYFVASDDPSSAMKSLKKFRSGSESNIINEIQTMKSLLEQDKQNIDSFSKVFRSKALFKAFVIAISLIAFQQFSGIIVVLFNSQAIFSATRSGMPPEISTMIVGVVQFAASFVTPLAVDKFGRKLLLLISAAGMFISEVSLGLYFYMQDTGKNVSSISWLPILCLVIYIIFYNFGFGIVPWTVIAEVFPTNIKAPASTIATCFCALSSFVLTYFFISLNAALGMGGTFWLFSAFCAIALPFVKFYMIETKGKSFQEIQTMLNK